MFYRSTRSFDAESLHISSMTATSAIAVAMWIHCTAGSHR